MTAELYQALIVEHDRHPRHRGTLAGATHAATIDNPLCGDVATVTVIVDAGRVAEIACDGPGCALSRAAASLMAERVAGASLAEIRALAAMFETFVAEPMDAPVPAELGDLGAFAGVRAARSRRTCATLPFRALLEALQTGQRPRE